VATRSACLQDTECQTGQYCDTASTTCKAKLANGEALPKSPGHTPDLTGVCNANVAGAVCASGACDLADNRCGYADGHGRCTDANAASVCRSKLCDPIGFCGFVDDGQLQGGGCSTTADGDGESGRASLAVLGMLALAVRGRRRKHPPLA
jgi:MYXO-CTERM domain-containing protein